MAIIIVLVVVIMILTIDYAVGIEEQLLPNEHGVFCEGNLTQLDKEFCSLE